MAEEKPSESEQQGNSGSSGKKKRRRYSRNRNRRRKSRKDGSEPRVARGAPTGDEQSQRARRDRRRRRRTKTTGQPEDTQLSQQIMENEFADLQVGAVSIYTHVIRPSLRDSYEFRSDHFSKVSRRLEDFKIDLSPLFPEELETGSQEEPPSEA